MTQIDGPSTSTRGILNPRAEGTHFHLARHAPSADLAPLVERYWVVRWDLRGRAPHVQETLPHPCVNLAIETRTESALHGVGTRRFAVTLAERGLVVGAKFRPGAFYPFLNAPVCELTDRVVPLGAAFGADGDALARAVLACDDEPTQIALLEAFLRARRPRPDANVATAVRVAQTALEHPEIRRVEDLAARVDVPARALQRLFRRYVGVSPKWVIRRYRIHEAAERAAAHGALDWGALACELGYFDQAHFIKDFRAQVGRSPTAYAAHCAPR